MRKIDILLLQTGSVLLPIVLHHFKSNQIYFQMQKQCTQQTCNAFGWYSKAYSTYSCPVLQFHL